MKFTISLATVLCITLAGVLFLGVPAFAADEEDLKLGDIDQDWVYTAVEPCRIVNTVNTGEPFEAEESRKYYTYGNVKDQNGGQPAMPNNCPAPQGEPTAVHINVTVKGHGTGNVRVYPAGTFPVPTASWINFKPGQTIANAGTVKARYNTVNPANREIEVYSSCAADVIIDVMGYYYPVKDLFLSEDFQSYKVRPPIKDHDLKFLAPVAQVKVKKGQKIFVVSHATFHADDEKGDCQDGADELNLWICYENPLDGGLEKVGKGAIDIEAQPDTRFIQGLSAMIYELPAATYDVGLCGKTTSKCWAEYEWERGYTTAFVVPTTDTLDD